MTLISRYQNDGLSGWVEQQKIQRSHRKEIYSKEFVKRSEETPAKGGVEFKTYGYQPDGDDIAPEYLARITSIRNRATVVGVLQEDIQTRVESRWEPLVPTSLLSTGNILLQVVQKGRGAQPRSLITRATSRRMWVGTSPMILSLSLHFEAVEDAWQDVAMPCKILQAIAAPTEPAGRLLDHNSIRTEVKNGNVTKALSKLPTLGPPGPSPFNLQGILTSERSFNDLSKTDVSEGLGGGDFIRVQLGRFLTFDDVIVREGSVRHKIKFTSEGNPISAVVNIVFETYEMITVEGLDKIYNKTVMSENIER